jgi:hypothetical protein
MRGFFFAALFAYASTTGASAAGVAGRGPFTIVGNKTFDSSGAWVVFRGIGMSCTEYFARPGYPAPPPGGKPEWPGNFGWGCFGGRPDAPVEPPLGLNNETANMLKYLLPDTAGGAFVTQPALQRARWPAPYDQVLAAGAPRVVPIVRMPVTSGTFMYDMDANALGSAGYRFILDSIIQSFTSQGVAVIIDQHGCCAGSLLNCSHRSGPMALRDYGNHSGAVGFWDLASSLYANNSMVFYELYNEPHVWAQALYGGDPLYAGHADMYDAVRKNAPQGLVIIGGTGYAQDAAGLLAIAEQYRKEHAAPMTNVLWNLHPCVVNTAARRAARRAYNCDRNQPQHLTPPPPSSPPPFSFFLFLATKECFKVYGSQCARPCGSRSPCSSWAPSFTPSWCVEGVRAWGTRVRAQRFTRTLPSPLQGQYCCNSNDTSTGAPQGKCNDHAHGDWVRLTRTTLRPPAARAPATLATLTTAPTRAPRP